MIFTRSDYNMLIYHLTKFITYKYCFSLIGNSTNEGDCELIFKIPTMFKDPLTMSVTVSSSMVDRDIDSEILDAFILVSIHVKSQDRSYYGGEFLNGFDIDAVCERVELHCEELLHTFPTSYKYLNVLNCDVQRLVKLLIDCDVAVVNVYQSIYTGERNKFPIMHRGKVNMRSTALSHDIRTRIKCLYDDNQFEVNLDFQKGYKMINIFTSSHSNGECYIDGFLGPTASDARLKHWVESVLAYESRVKLTPKKESVS